MASSSPAANYAITDASGAYVAADYTAEPTGSAVTITGLFTWDGDPTQTWDSDLSVNRTWGAAWQSAAWLLNVEETISVQEAIANCPALFKQETLSVAEATTFDASVVYAETLSIAEVFDRTAVFQRSFEESLLISEFLVKGCGLNKSEAFRISDAWRRQADMVICDMILSGVPTTYTVKDFKDFMSYGNPAGFERWRDFVPGDYEYKDALFRIIMESKTADRGMLSGLQASIDVPDTYDHGSANVSVAMTGAAVTFNREFHIIPEITMSVRSGTTSNPVVVEFYGSPTITGFTARLRDTVTGSYVTGSFTWAAHGY